MTVIWQLWATLLNEWRCLLRDRTGLILLFAMPTALVIVLTLVQEPLYKREKGMHLQGLVVDQDGGPAGRAVIDGLTRSALVSIASSVDGRPIDEAAARAAVTKGHYQFCLVLPPALSALMNQRMESLIGAALSREQAPPQASALPSLTVWYDPAIQEGYRAMVAGAVAQSAAIMETGLGMQIVLDHVERRLRQMGGSFTAPAPQLPQFDFIREGLVPISEKLAGRETRLPSAVQHNVPAWALFGMFFIVVPLSAGMIRERREGISDRLLTMPIHRAVLMLGRIGAFGGVCILQFTLVMMIGKWVLPLIGTDALVIEGGPAPLAAVMLCSALAATGFGVMIGGLTHTHEQAGVVGPVAVVIAAAVGGIMVPVFAMPHFMQTLSHLSPLAWAHGAFIILLVQGGSWSDIAGRLLMLLLFFAAALTIAQAALRRHQRRL